MQDNNHFTHHHHHHLDNRTETGEEAGEEEAAEEEEAEEEAVEEEATEAEEDFRPQQDRDYSHHTDEPLILISF
jgi:hypothetical protein